MKQFFAALLLLQLILTYAKADTIESLTELDDDNALIIETLRTSDKQTRDLYSECLSDIDAQNCVNDVLGDIYNGEEN